MSNIDDDLKEIREQARKIGRKGSLLTMGFDEVADVISGLVERTGCERGSVFKIDLASGQLVSLYAQGIDEGDIKLSLHLGVAGLVAVTGKVINIPDTSEDPRFDYTIDIRTGYETRNAPSMMLAYMTADIGAHHNRAWVLGYDVTGAWTSVSDLISSGGDSEKCRKQRSNRNAPNT